MDRLRLKGVESQEKPYVFDRARDMTIEEKKAAAKGSLKRKPSHSPPKQSKKRRRLLDASDSESDSEY